MLSWPSLVTTGWKLAAQRRHTQRAVPSTLRVAQAPASHFGITSRQPLLLDRASDNCCSFLLLLNANGATPATVAAVAEVMADVVDSSASSTSMLEAADDDGIAASVSQLRLSSRRTAAM